MQPYELFGKIIPIAPSERIGCAALCPLRDGGSCDSGPYIAGEITGLGLDPRFPKTPAVLVSPVGYICMRDVQEPPDAPLPLPPAVQGE